MRKRHVVIVGAGICGAATAYFLSRRTSPSQTFEVSVLEAEDTFNVHSSGRSASYFVPMYETWLLARLAREAEPFLQSPPDGFADHPLIDRRGAVLGADAAHAASHDEEVRMARELDLEVQELDPSGVQDLIPVLRPGELGDPKRLVRAAAYAAAGALDTHALSMGYIAQSRRAGVKFHLGQRLRELRWSAGRICGVETDQGSYPCDVLVNAAGAWAGEVAALAQASAAVVDPRRRHVIGVELPAQFKGARWPFFRCPSWPLYFRPEAGQILASAMDADPVPPSDCPTDDLQVAVTAQALSDHTTLEFRRLATSWAGLRVYSADGVPLVGWDAQREDFLWVACTGGVGMQSSPAVGALAARYLAGEHPQDELARRLDPARHSAFTSALLQGQELKTDPV